MDYGAYIFKIFLFLIVFSSIAFLAYTGTKFLGKKVSRSMRGKAIQVVESINLGIDKQLHLVRIGSRYYMIPSSGRNLGELKEVELDPAVIEKMSELENENQEPINIENDFRTVWNKFTNAAKMGTGESMGQDVFRKNLDRLRSITQDKMINKGRPN